MISIKDLKSQSQLMFFLSMLTVIMIAPLCKTAHANPIDPFFPAESPVADLFIIFLSFFLEYSILRKILTGHLTIAGQSRFCKAFIGANLISYPITWAIFLSVTALWPVALIAGIVLGELIAITIEILLYNKWIDLRHAGKRG
jgi:hypothetical protein